MTAPRFDATFSNDLAAREFVTTLTDAFKRMEAVAQTATTPQQALHEALAVSNGVFSRLPLPTDNPALAKAAAAANSAHADMLRALADFNPASEQSRVGHNNRVTAATKKAMTARSNLLTRLNARGNKRSRPRSKDAGDEVVDFITMIYGDEQRGKDPVSEMAESVNNLDALFAGVVEKYGKLAATRGGSAAVSPNTAAVVQPIVDVNAVGAALVNAKLNPVDDDNDTNAPHRHVMRQLAPERTRPNYNEPVPLAIAAAHIRAHAEFPGTVASGVKSLPSIGQDIDEFRSQYADANIFARLFSALLEQSQSLHTLSSAFTFDTIGERRQRLRVVLINRANELRERLTLIDRAPTTRAAVDLMLAQLDADVRRGTFERYVGWYDQQLRSLVTADTRREKLLAFIDDRMVATDEERRARSLRTYEEQTNSELARLRARVMLLDAESGVGSPFVTREQKLTMARAEITDRLYESDKSLLQRLSGNAALSGLRFEVGAPGEITVGVDVSAPPELLALPAGPRATEITTIEKQVAERMPLPGMNVEFDPALDDGDVWRIGFKGRLGPGLVEMLFASPDLQRITAADRIGRLPLLRAYVRSVGAINRVSARGTGDVNVETFDRLVEFGVSVDLELQRSIGASLDELVFDLTLFNVDGNRVAGSEQFDEPSPRVLTKVPLANVELHQRALTAITEIVALFRTHSLAAVYRLGDTLSISNHTDIGDIYGLGTLDVAPDTPLNTAQRTRAREAIDRASETVTRGTTRALIHTNDLPVPSGVETLSATAQGVDVAFKTLTVQPYGLTGRVLSGPSAADAGESGTGQRLIYLGHRVPASLFDPALGDVYADIEYRAGTSDQSAANEAAMERVLASTDTRMLRTVTRYDVPNAMTGQHDIVVDDVLRYTTAREAQRLQIIDIFERASVTLTLRDPVTDRVEARVLDRVMFGASLNTTTDAQSILNNLRAEVAASSAGQPLLALVAALFIRARLRTDVPSPFGNLPSGTADQPDADEGVLRRLFELPARGLKSFRSLLDVVMAFSHERNFASQAMLALSIAYANINFLVLLFGVAQSVWPGVVYLLRSVGFIDALSRALFQALIGAARAVGYGISWTLVSNLLGIFEQMSFRHPRQGAARREAALLRTYLVSMTAAGSTLTPLDAIPGGIGGELFIDRMYRFVITYGSPARRALARRTFKTMVDRLFAPLYALLGRIPQSISGVVAAAAWIVAGESVSPSPFSVLVLGSLNVFATTLFVYTLPACDNVWLAFFKVFVTNILTRAAWRRTFEAIMKVYPRGRSGVPYVDSFVRAGRYGLTALSVIGPDLTSYVTGREYVMLDGLQSAARAVLSKLTRGHVAWPSDESLMRRFDPTSSSGVLRFVDQPSQAVDAYVSFAGRFAGRTFWSILRTYMALREQRALNASALRSPRGSVSATESDADTDLPWMDELDRRETLDAYSSRGELQRAFFGRDGEVDIWAQLLTSALRSHNRRFDIDIGGDFIGPSTVDNRYALRRPQTFVMARNFLFRVAQLRDRVLHELVFVRGVFLLEVTSAVSIDVARRTWTALMLGNMGRASDPEEALLSAADGERFEFDTEHIDVPAQPEIERLIDDNGHVTGYRAWREFVVDSSRFNEFGTTIDRLTRLSGVRLVNIELHTVFELDEDARVDLVERTLDYLAETRGLIGIVQDLDIDEFGAEVASFAQ